ncbi:MAG TPA: hypothetical protein VLJ58_07890, partial [Ramlibacter sp.]|nr:hypothetical protein [Ramlibacter sp.]
MGIAVFTFGGLLAPLQGLAQWWLGLSQGAGRRGGRASSPMTPAQQAATCAATSRARPQPPCPQGRAPARPLRILRVVDSSHGKAGTGRLVISGRLADVCAELDRLAALE